MLRKNKLPSIFHPATFLPLSHLYLLIIKCFFVSIYHFALRRHTVTTICRCSKHIKVVRLIFTVMGSFFLSIHRISVHPNNCKIPSIYHLLCIFDRINECGCKKNIPTMHKHSTKHLLPISYLRH